MTEPKKIWKDKVLIVFPDGDVRAIPAQWTKGLSSFDAAREQEEFVRQVAQFLKAEQYHSTFDERAVQSLLLTLEKPAVVDLNECRHHSADGQCAVQLQHGFPDRQVRGLCALCNKSIHPKEWRISASDAAHPFGVPYVVEEHKDYRIVRDLMALGKASKESRRGGQNAV
jgi:hypothetical protein